MNRNIQLLAGSLFILSSVAVAAANDSASTTHKASCCMVANGCAQHSKRSLKKINEAVSRIESVRDSNDPKALHEALDIAWRSLSDVKENEGKNERAMNALYSHLTKVEEKAQSLDNMLSGDGLDDAQFIVAD